MSDSWIDIGGVRSVNPARREIRVAAKGAHVHEFDELEWLRVAFSSGECIRCKVDEARPHGDLFVIRFAPGVPRDTVGRMKGATVVVGRDDQKVRVPGAYHLSDLPGLTVVTEAGAVLGQIVDALATGANDVIEIEKAGGGTMMLPVIEQVVVAVDVAAARFVVGDIAPYVVDEDDEGEA